ncbi:MAG: hypothetical protein PHR35_05855 [Kiritimatiellae bacterium]|nr:hypothetical protein [Kiritimatiellia bacterium]
MTLATLAELKGRLGITDTTEDTALTAALQRIEDRMAAHCEREWALATRTEYFTGPLGWLLLKAFPVVSIDSLTLEGVLLTENSDFVLRADRGRITYAFDDGVWPDDGEIAVTYRGGFVAAGGTPGTGETAVPAELAAALLTQAEWEWRNKQVLGLKSASQSGVSVAAADYDWLPAVLDAMGPCRRFGR